MTRRGGPATRCTALGRTERRGPAKLLAGIGGASTAGFRLLPRSASAVAHQVDWLYLALVLLSAAVLALVFGLMIVFCVRYRATSPVQRGGPVQKTWRWEATWTSLSFLAFIGLFFWGAQIYLEERDPPRSAMEVYVVAKQWMWKVEYRGGQAEIDSLHVPRNVPVRLVMASQDVIHDFFVPAFRVKQDVVPGRYEDLWFTPTKIGRYHLFCAQLCGVGHALMGGQVVVMAPADFQKWLAAQPSSGSLVSQGFALFRQYGCSGCHEPGSTIHAPRLAGLYGRPVALRGGGFVTADRAYIHDKILFPNKQIPAGYAADMPSFDGRVSEGDILKLIAYIQSLAFAPGERQMSVAALPEPRQAVPENNYLTDGFTLRSWLLTTDHKRIAILYFISLTFFFFIGGAAATLIRINLLVPGGLLGDGALYNRLFTMHGVIMVWFFLVPAIPTTLGNFLVPLMIGAHDLAFPRINLGSWYLFMLGGSLTLIAIFLGGLGTGWTFYPPFSSSYASGRVALALFGIFVSGFSSIMTGLNFVVTIHRLRAPGMTWFRLPLFVWSIYATSVILMLATPVLAITLLLTTIERLIRVGIFDPSLGGDPLLYQHMFWFYSHPAVYIMILPGMGVVSELITCFARKPIFGYQAMAWSMMSIAVIGFLVWGHHMFVSGELTFSALIFSFLSFVVAAPSAIKVFNWTASLHGGWIRFDAPMLYALGFVGLFTIGGLTGLYLATLGFDVAVHSTYFVIAHFHYIMVGGMVTAYFGGLHYWWPKITGRLYHEWWARIAAILIFVGFNFTFFPQFILGYLGMPRRYFAYPPEFQVWNVLSSAGASILAIGYALPLFYLGYSLFRGERAGPNPWQATGLEWQTASPPPTENFDRTPVVTRGPYDYRPEAIPQNG